MGRPVVHWELWSKEPEKLSAFYEKVFEWNVNFVEPMNYRIVQTGSERGINGGIFQPQEGPWPGNMCFYVQVDDLEAHLQRIEAAGGKAIVRRQEIPGMGAMALFADPDGRVLGLWCMS